MRPGAKSPPRHRLAERLDGLVQTEVAEGERIRVSEPAHHHILGGPPSDPWYRHQPASHFGSIGARIDDDRTAADSIGQCPHRLLLPNGEPDAGEVSLSERL
jgi:hypothetical protein